MVVDLLVNKIFQKISTSLGFVTCIAVIPWTNLVAQVSPTKSLGKTELPSSTIFLKDMPRPKITTVQTVKHVKAKPPVRNFSVYGIDDGLALQSVFSGYKDHDGNLWFGTAGGGASKFDGRTFKNFDERHGLGNGVIRAIAQDKSGNYYFGTRTGLSFYNGEKITNYYVKDGLPPKPIACMIVDANDHVWCGTQGAGLVKFDGEKFTTYSVREGLFNNNVRSLEIDNNGLLWIGTQGGVVTFDGNQFRNFKTPDHRDKTVYDIHEDSKGNMWFACAEGILKFDGKALQYFSVKDGVSDWRVLSIGESIDGTIWCALIKMGLENREIAMLLNIEASSVKMAKYRLKKKFNIDESVSLRVYFETL